MPGASSSGSVTRNVDRKYGSGVYMRAARSRDTTLSCCGMIFEMPMALPNAWFIAWKNKIPVRSWMEIWSRRMRRYTTPKSRQKNVFIAYLMVSVATSRVCSRQVRKNKSLNGIQNCDRA